MPGIGSSLIAGAVTIVGSSTHKIYNVPCATASTEYSQALSSGVVQLFLRSRHGGKIQMSFVAGETGSKFITVPAGSGWNAMGLSLVGKTLYFQSDKNSDVIEIEEWT